MSTLLDGDPDNNFLKRALTFNPDGLLTGAVNITIAGHYAYVWLRRGLVVVDLDDPLKPRIVATVGEPHLKAARGGHPVPLRLRDRRRGAEGHRRDEPAARGRCRPRWCGWPTPRHLYLARTYAYVAAGAQGLVILDIERPEAPTLDQIYDAGGAINDARDVKVGMTNASVFAYVADGKNGLRVVQLTSPEETPSYSASARGRSPRLIATVPHPGPGPGRLQGHRPRPRGGRERQSDRRLRPASGAGRSRCPRCSGCTCGTASVYTVTDEPPAAPRAPAAPKKEEEPATEPQGGPRIRRPR